MNAKAQARLEAETDNEQSEAEREEAKHRTVTDLMQRADDALAMEDQRKAAEIYQEVVQIQPTHVGALHRLAILFDMNGNFTRSEIYFRRALEFAPDDPTLLNDIGYSCLRQQRLEDSEHYLQESMNIDPNNQITLRNIGILLALQGNPQAAQEFFHRGGLSDEEAQQEYVSFLSSISTPHSLEHAASIDELSKSQNTPTAFGQFAPPDLESTYGLKGDPRTQDAEPDRYASRDQQGVERPSAQPPGRMNPQTPSDHPDESIEGTSRFTPEIASGSGYSSYDLERAALNAGPGSLFPIAAVHQTGHRQPHLRAPFAALQDWGNVQPAGFGEPASNEDRNVPHGDSNPVREQESPFIQSPTGRTSDPRAYTSDSTGFPVTQQNTNDPSRITPSYYQFPGSSSQPASSEASEHDYSESLSPNEPVYR